MRKLTCTAVAMVMALSIASPLASRDKIRIAIWDFEDHTEQRWWFSGDLGPAARNQIDNAFSENSELSRMFSVVERERLDMVMKEQGLSTSGAIDPQTAARVGQVLGIRYIVTGGVDKFAINTTRGGFGGIGGSRTEAEATISLRFIDATTAARVVSVSADGKVNKGGGFIRGASLSRDDEWGIASEAVEKASEEVVKALTEGNNLERISEAAGSGAGAVDMRVIRVDGTKAYINVGSMAGVKVGDKFGIFEQGEALIDPATGMNLGSVETEIGSGVVVDVQERFAIIEVTGKAVANAAIKKGS